MRKRSIPFVLAGGLCLSTASTALPDQGLAAPPKGKRATHAKQAKWPAGLPFQPWDAGLRRARTQGKGLLVLVYADWCARCKELTPALGDARVRALAKDVVLVRQNQDDNPAWLRERFGQYGRYVPRVFFVEPSGIVREDLVSQHPRFPYFYAATAIDQLVSNMKQLAGK